METFAARRKEDDVGIRVDASVRRRKIANERGSDSVECSTRLVGEDEDIHLASTDIVTINIPQVTEPFCDSLL